ncbi:MAG TPA: twin-arginine translocase TatA/TatE family subunit [Clostridiales bacterium]|nr:twin-arginine translocase TatA/TatE family subunit [Clostridiales bacterium]
MRIGIWQILLIIVLVLILFGGSKLAGVGKSLGRGIKEFKEEIHSDEEKPPAVEQKKEAAQGDTDKEEKPLTDEEKTEKKQNTE